MVTWEVPHHWRILRVVAGPRRSTRPTASAVEEGVLRPTRDPTPTPAPAAKTHLYLHLDATHLADLDSSTASLGRV
ncbi:MAG: hypothetical protein ABIQ15_05890, partial [Nocardioides sp.]